MPTVTQQHLKVLYQFLSDQLLEHPDMVSQWMKRRMGHMPEEAQQALLCETIEMAASQCAEKFLRPSWMSKTGESPLKKVHQTLDDHQKIQDAAAKGFELRAKPTDDEGWGEATTKAKKDKGKEEGSA